MCPPRATCPGLWLVGCRKSDTHIGRSPSIPDLHLYWEYCQTLVRRIAVGIVVTTSEHRSDRNDSHQGDFWFLNACSILNRIFTHELIKIWAFKWSFQYKLIYLLYLYSLNVNFYSVSCLRNSVKVLMKFNEDRKPY